jgi:hypothetical protein
MSQWMTMLYRKILTKPNIFKAAPSEIWKRQAKNLIIKNKFTLIREQAFLLPERIKIQDRFLIKMWINPFVYIY